jgi:hypothetical protein
VVIITPSVLTIWLVCALYHERLRTIRCLVFLFISEVIVLILAWAHILYASFKSDDNCEVAAAYDSPAVVGVLGTYVSPF